MITVNVRLFSILRHRSDGEVRDRLVLELPDGAIVADVLAELGAPDLPIVISINDQQADPSAVLRDGDEVGLIPAVAGGASRCGTSRNCTVWRRLALFGEFDGGQDFPNLGRD